MDDTTTIVPLLIRGAAAVVHLTRGQRAMIDAADWERVKEKVWHAHPANGQGTPGYYARSGSEKSGAYLHTFLIGEPWVDHKNRDKLDCRRANLRVCTPSQNASNWVRPPNRSGYRGVRVQRNGKFQAQIRVNGKFRGLGTYERAEDAARAYDRAAVEAFGEFAHPNFPNELEAVA